MLSIENQLYLTRRFYKLFRTFQVGFHVFDHVLAFRRRYIVSCFAQHRYPDAHPSTYIFRLKFYEANLIDTNGYGSEEGAWEMSSAGRSNIRKTHQNHEIMSFWVR